ncbi:MAG: restriction endonuclease subunit S, partial [archaeon]
MAKISVVDLSLTKLEKRLDAEYYKTEFLDNDAKICSHDFKPLVKLTKKIDVGFVGSMVQAYTDKGISLLQTRNIDEFFTNLNSIVSITEKFHKLLKKSQIHYGDILVARSGSFGNASIYLDQEICNSSDIIILEPNSEINPFYLVAFLNSKFGRNQLLRFASGGVQGHVNLTILEQLKVPLLQEKVQVQIQNMVQNSKIKIDLANKQYHTAEQLLLNELSFSDYSPKHQLSFESNLKEIIEKERYDAEYYQPMYKKIRDKITNYLNKSKPLKEIIKIKKATYFPKDNQEYKYIELSNISSNGTISSCALDLGKNLPSRARRKLVKGDVIISSIEGSLDSCAIITEEYDGALCSTGFFVINSNEINPETLLVLSK